MVAEALAIMLKEVSPTQRKIKAKVKESKMAKKVVEHKGTTPHKHPHPKVEAKQEDTKKEKVEEVKKVKEDVNPRSVTLANLRTLMEQDLDQAELVLAAKDMVDRLQKMAEDLASMQVEDLMPLVDAMRESFGTEQANAFSASVDATFEGIIGCN